MASSLHGVGMPAALYLDQFGAVVRDAFGHYPYHVGSSLTQKSGWRDVDVRLILPDDEYAALMLGDTVHQHSHPKWTALVLAFAALGHAMTGLPIDFQIQQQSKANDEYGGPRSALGVHAQLRTQWRASRSTSTET